MRRTEIVEIELDNGEVIRVEASMPAGGDVAGRSPRMLASRLGDDIKGISRWLVSELRDAMPDEPDRIGLEFGIKIAGETGRVFGVLGKVGAEAAVVVKVEWSNTGHAEPGP